MGLALCTALLLGLSGTAARADTWDWLSLNPLSAEVFLRYSWVERQSDDAVRLRDTELEPGARIGLSGSILDPGIASFDITIEPVSRSGDYEAGTLSEDRDGDFLSYTASLSLLRDALSDFSGILGASRATDTNIGSLGSRSENDVTTRYANLSWNFEPFPLQFQYQERQWDQLFRSGFSGGVSERDELLKTISMIGANRKMRLDIERQTLDDRVADRNQDFDIDTINWDHRFQWGKGSTLFSQFNFYDRTGFNASKRTSLREMAQIRHLHNLSSTTYLEVSTSEQQQKVDERRGEFQLQHSLFRNLTTTGRLSGLSRESDISDERNWLVGINSEYHKSNLWGGTARAGAGLAYEQTDRISNGGLVEVVDEPQTVPLSGEVTLNRRFVLASTVVVTDVDGIFVYSEGSDYELVFPGDDLTQLFIIPGGRIETGDQIRVSYRAESSPTLNYDTVHSRYDIGFDLGWVRVSHSSSEADDTLRSGQGDRFINDLKNTFSDLEFRWDANKFSTRFIFERSDVRNGELRTLTKTAKQQLDYTPSPRVSVQFSMIESRIESQDRDTELLSLELSTEWRPTDSLSIRPRLGAWRRTDASDMLNTPEREDEFFSGGFYLRWQLRQVSLDMNYFHNRRTTDERLTVEDRVMFNLRRRF